MHALSTRNDSPETASCPFSASRDGFVIGEGAACLILEELEHAKEIMERISMPKWLAQVCRPTRITLPYRIPKDWARKLVMRNALEDADMKPEEIDYVNVHGTSTPVGDILESKAILDVFGEHSYKLNISSTKSMTGHLLGAAGGIEVYFLRLGDREWNYSANHQS